MWSSQKQLRPEKFSVWDSSGYTMIKCEYRAGSNTTDFRKKFSPFFIINIKESTSHTCFPFRLFWWYCHNSCSTILKNRRDFLRSVAQAKMCQRNPSCQHFLTVMLCNPLIARQDSNRLMQCACGMFVDLILTRIHLVSLCQENRTASTRPLPLRYVLADEFSASHRQTIPSISSHVDSVHRVKASMSMVAKHKANWTVGLNSGWILCN